MTAFIENILKGVREAIETLYVKINNTFSELTNQLATKQDTIADLDTIRSGAGLGATALQEHQDVSALLRTINGTSLIKIGDIEEDDIQVASTTPAGAAYDISIRIGLLSLTESVYQLFIYPFGAMDAATYHASFDTFITTAGRRLGLVYQYQFTNEDNDWVGYISQMAPDIMPLYIQVDNSELNGKIMFIKLFTDSNTAIYTSMDLVLVSNASGVTIYKETIAD